MKKHLLFLASLFVLTLFATNGHAQAITWTASTITGESDVLTEGILVEALNFSGGAEAADFNTTINGVPFTGFVSGAATGNAFVNPTSDYFSCTSDNVVPFTVDQYDPALGIAAFDVLLSNFLWDGTVDTITLSGLTVGHEYKVQLFEADKRNSQAGSYIVLEGNFGDATTTAYAETAGLSIVGSFTATETSIWFTISKVLPPTEGGAQVNAYQLRDVTNTATANQFSKPSFTAYPNPANDVISVKGLEQGTYRATIYSLTGSNCLSTQLKGNQNSIAINQLPAGTYLLNVVGDNLNVTKKFDKR